MLSPQTIHEAVNALDANEWMYEEINDMRRFDVFDRALPPKKRHKANMEAVSFDQCPRSHAVFRIGCAFWLDDETGVGSPYKLQRVAAMFKGKYGISIEGEMKWTLRIGVSRDCKARIISLSSERDRNHNPPSLPVSPFIIEQCTTAPLEPQKIADNNYRELTNIFCL